MVDVIRPILSTFSARIIDSNPPMASRCRMNPKSIWQLSGFTAESPTGLWPAPKVVVVVIGVSDLFIVVNGFG